MRLKVLTVGVERDVKLTAFADDMTTFLKVLNDFGLCSGLKLNKSKLEACYLALLPLLNFVLTWTSRAVSSIEILGIFFSYNKKEAANLIYGDGRI